LPVAVLLLRPQRKALENRMSTLSTLVDTFKFNRDRTLKTLSTIEAEANPRAVLAWRPGPGRAHIGWQLTHIGITEELFASDRLGLKKPPAFAELLERFRGGSTPDDDMPAPELIRRILTETRERLLATVNQLDEQRLDDIPEGLLKERGWSLRTALQVIAWHEPHHQGQAHITHNLYKAAHSK
jgi:uncharacterized damage-inducible protein DinB